MGEKIGHRLLERAQDHAACAGQAGVHSVRAILGEHPVNRVLAEIRRTGRFARQRMPADRSLVDEMPDAAFVVE